MFSTPARRIYSITLIAASLFYLIGLFPPAQNVGAAQATTTIAISQPYQRPVGTTTLPHIQVSRPQWYQPLQKLYYQPTIRCILLKESVSTEAHPNLGDTDPYQFGPFQFTPLLWNRWSWAAGVGSKTSSWSLGSLSLNAVTIPAYKSTLYQQAKVFAYVARYDGLWPWRNSDGC